MFAALFALPLAIAATAFAFFIFAIAVGLTLAAVLVQAFIVRFKSRRAGLVLPVIALCICSLSVLGSMLAGMAQVGFGPESLYFLFVLLFDLLVWNLPAGLLLLERHLILKWMRKRGLYIG